MRRRGILLSSSALAVASALFVLLVGAPPAADANPLGDITDISAGEGQTCALITTGAVKCWGEPGLLGGAPSNGAFPAVVPGVSSASSVSAGLNQTCAITSGGGVVCWGRSSAPGPVPGLTGVVQVDAGNESACAVTSVGSVMCWSDASGPTPIEGIDNATYVDVGIEHTCAVTTSGNVKCWGKNQYGELGDGTTIDRLVPVTISGLSGATSVATALNHTCALSTSAVVSCWGYRYGASPTVPMELSDVTAIQAVYNHTCVLTSGGSVKCWGANDYGQLGDGYGCGIGCGPPVDVSGLNSGVSSIAVGVNHTCALLDDASAKCWGNNFVGQLGDGRGGSRAVSPHPTSVAEHESKSDPCPPEGCPAPPVRPILRDGLDFSIGIDTNGDGMEECGTNEGQAPECVAALMSAVNIVVSLHSLPEGLPGYSGIDIILDESLFPVGPQFEFLWPDCIDPVTAHQSLTARVAFGCSGSSQFESTYSGQVLRTQIVCSRTGSVAMLHSNGNTSIVDRHLRTHYEASTGSESVLLTCGEKIAGDVDCSSTVSPVDAALTLQREATIIDRVRCEQQADVNMDNNTNAVDAALTLQYTAGLVTSLPVPPH